MRVGKGEVHEGASRASRPPVFVWIRSRRGCRRVKRAAPPVWSSATRRTVRDQVRDVPVRRLDRTDRTGPCAVGVRFVTRAPGFAVGAVLTLGLGVGVNTATAAAAGGETALRR